MRHTYFSEKVARNALYNKKLNMSDFENFQNEHFIQRKLFELGFKWYIGDNIPTFSEYRKLDKPFLYIREDDTFISDNDLLNFHYSTYEEISPKDILNIKVIDTDDDIQYMKMFADYVRLNKTPYDNDSRIQELAATIHRVLT